MFNDVLVLCFVFFFFLFFFQANQPFVCLNEQDKMAAENHKVNCSIYFQSTSFMNQSFVSPAPLGTGNSGAFNFQFQSFGKSPALRDQICGKIPSKSSPVA